MPAYVVFRVSRALGEQIVQGRADAAARGVVELLERHGAAPAPVTVPDPEARDHAVFVTVPVADMPTADALAMRLRALRGVDFAYAKPGEEAP